MSCTHQPSSMHQATLLPRRSRAPMSAQRPFLMLPSSLRRIGSSSNWENLGGSFFKPAIRIHHVFDQTREVVERNPTQLLSSLTRVPLELVHVPRPLLR